MTENDNPKDAAPVWRVLGPSTVAPRSVQSPTGERWLVYGADTLASAINNALETKLRAAEDCDHQFQMALDGWIWCATCGSVRVRGRQLWGKPANGTPNLPAALRDAEAERDRLVAEKNYVTSELSWFDEAKKMAARIAALEEQLRTALEVIADLLPWMDYRAASESALERGEKLLADHAERTGK